MKRVYSEEQKEKRRQAKRLWYQKNKDRVSLYNKTYSETYRNEHHDELIEKKRQYYNTHQEERKQQTLLYSKTQIGRASNLASSYAQMDKKNGVGKSTITKEWIVNNIFNNSCVYCGESDWTKLGCDRKDNSLPHTEDNCVPCCGECNRKKKTMSYDEYMKKILGE